MTSLGFENYSEALKIYLARYREVSYRTLHFSYSRLADYGRDLRGLVMRISTSNSAKILGLSRSSSFAQKSRRSVDESLIT